MANTAPARSTTARRNPLILGGILAGGAFFIGLKWRAVLARSEAAKKEGTKDLTVKAGERSGGGV